MEKTSNNLTTFAGHLDCRYDKIGRQRDAFKPGVMLYEPRKEKGMKQSELINKYFATKNYISCIENDTVDSRLYGIMRIFPNGFGDKLQLHVHV